MLHRATAANTKVRTSWLNTGNRGFQHLHQMRQLIFGLAPEAGLDVAWHPSSRVTDMSHPQQGPNPPGHLLRLEVHNRRTAVQDRRIPNQLVVEVAVVVVCRPHVVRTEAKRLKKGQYVEDGNFRDMVLQMSTAEYRRPSDNAEFDIYKGKAGGKTYWGHPESIKAKKQEGIMR
jgi:hypothetical protein